MPFVAAIATWTASIRAFGGSAPVRSSVFARAPVPRPIDSMGIPVNFSNRRAAAVASAPPRFLQDGPRYKEIEAASTCPPFSRDLLVR